MDIYTKAKKKFVNNQICFTSLPELKRMDQILTVCLASGSQLADE